jgi:hypothetical protein
MGRSKVRFLQEEQRVFAVYILLVKILSVTKGKYPMNERQVCPQLRPGNKADEFPIRVSALDDLGNCSGCDIFA